ncbi:MAG TPA: helix-turn-helix transcriptional regulator [Gemmatimonadaceae bacterium]|nr:helix-turn-helix transcriptional regulator [Gemmatimonadaceae bacterium]
MPSQVAQRIFRAHLELSYRLGRRVTLAELGQMIAKEMRRAVPFTAAAVSRWENGLQIPSLRVIEAIASVTGVDPGWISHGEKTAAKGPVEVPDSARGDVGVTEPRSTPPIQARGTPRDARRKNRPR